MEQLPFYLQLIFGHPGNADISLILLVGAGRFERPTPAPKASEPTVSKIHKPSCIQWVGSMSSTAKIG